MGSENKNWEVQAWAMALASQNQHDSSSREHTSKSPMSAEYNSEDQRIISGQWALFSAHTEWNTQNQQELSAMYNKCDDSNDKYFLSVSPPNKKYE